MSISVFIEGSKTGANSKTMKMECEGAFRTLLQRCGFKTLPHLVACGGRDHAYEMFVAAMEQQVIQQNKINSGSKRGQILAKKAKGHDEFLFMLIDSEDPIMNIYYTWDHLKNRKGDEWDKPAGASDDQVLFMTTCMESWIITDRDTLKVHYKHDLIENRLIPLDQIENRNRHFVHERLEKATENCSNSYAKGTRSFEVLERLNPETLREHLPSFDRIYYILKKKLFT